MVFSKSRGMKVIKGVTCANYFIDNFIYIQYKFMFIFNAGFKWEYSCICILYTLSL